MRHLSAPVLTQRYLMIPRFRHLDVFSSDTDITVFFLSLNELWISH